MKKRILFFVLFLLLFPISCLASSSVVMDIDSGRILYEKNKDKEQLIASITKIMTCILVLENSSLEEEVTVGEEILKMVGTNIYLKVGEKMSVKDLLYGMMLRSGNDAAITLAVHVSQTEEEFVKRMNEKAKEIGMNHTTFSNSHGLDDVNYNYSTAYDMALLSQYAYQNEIYREIIKTKKYQAKSSLKSYSWYNRMSLLNQYSKCIGGKNGYTPKAGKTLVSLAKEDNLTLTMVSLDDSDSYQHHKNLYESLFQTYHNYLIIDKDSFSMQSFFLSNPIMIKQSFSYPLTEKEVDDIYTRIEMFSNKKKNQVGEIVVELKNQQIGRIPIIEKKIKKKKETIFDKILSFGL